MSACCTTCLCRECTCEDCTRTACPRRGGDDARPNAPDDEPCRSPE